MNANASQHPLHSSQPTSRGLIPKSDRIATFQNRAIGFLLLTVVLLLATYSLWVLSVWAAIAQPHLLAGLCLWMLNILSTLLTILTGAAGIFSAATFVSYRAKVLRCGSSKLSAALPNASSGTSHS